MKSKARVKAKLDRLLQHRRRQMELCADPRLQKVLGRRPCEEVAEQLFARVEKEADVLRWVLRDE